MKNLLFMLLSSLIGVACKSQQLATTYITNNQSVVSFSDSTTVLIPDTYIYKLSNPIVIVDSMYVTDSLLRRYPTIALSKPFTSNLSTVEWLFDEENVSDNIIYLFSHDGNNHLEINRHTKEIMTIHSWRGSTQISYVCRTSKEFEPSK